MTPLSPCRLKPLNAAIVIGWAALLALAIIGPQLLDPALVGDRSIRYTVRLSLLCYLLALLAMLRLDRRDWEAESPLGSAARWLWTLGWVSFAVHLGMAFHYAHGWSHDAAMRHTEQASGVAEGIFVSHLFSLLWTADALFWLRWPKRYAHRAPGIDRILHAFMAFMVFNGTVVFETGFIRYAGLAGFVLLGGAVWQAWRRGLPAPQPASSMPQAREASN